MPRWCLRAGTTTAASLPERWRSSRPFLSRITLRRNWPSSMPMHWLRWAAVAMRSRDTRASSQNRPTMSRPCRHSPSHCRRRTATAKPKPSRVVPGNTASRPRPCATRMRAASSRSAHSIAPKRPCAIACGWNRSTSTRTAIWRAWCGCAWATRVRPLRKFSNNDALWAAKAAVLQGAGDARGAYACLAARVERPQVPPALLVRAGLAALEFEPRTALDLAGRALHVTPADAAARTLQAAALLGVGDARAALPVCEALLARSPDDQYLIALQTTAWRMLGDERYAQLCDYPNLVVPYRLEPPPPWNGLADFLDDVKCSLDKLHGALRHPLLF